MNVHVRIHTQTHTCMRMPTHAYMCALTHIHRSLLEIYMKIHMALAVSHMQFIQPWNLSAEKKSLPRLLSAALFVWIMLVLLVCAAIVEYKLSLTGKANQLTPSTLDSKTKIFTIFATLLFFGITLSFS